MSEDQSPYTDPTELADRAVTFSIADHAEVLLTTHSQAATRWANNAITQNIAKTDARLTVKVAFGNRVGTASTNSLEEESLKRVVEKAEAIARASEPDNEYMPPVEPTDYPQVNAFHKDTADSTPNQRAEAIRQAVGLCEAQGVRSAGSFTVEHEVVTVANSRGLVATHPSSHSRFVCTAMTEDSSGWAEGISNDVQEIHPLEVTERAVQKALAAQHPSEVEAKRHTVILEPAAVAEILEFMIWSMEAKAAHEGRSAFTGKEGQRIAGPQVTLRSQPDHSICPGSPFFSDGMPAPPVTWVDGGVLTNLCYSRYWAGEKNHPFTGSPTNLLMNGSTETEDLDSMIASTEEGLLVTRFWYVRYVDPMKLLLTGMTRDGLFLIRDGKITSGVKNLRFNESPFNMLTQVEQLGTARRCGENMPCLAPALKVREFNFTSATTF